jgi:two-component system NtrC family sensor kinase
MLGRRAYDLVVSDLRMPELDGPGLYREAERRHPDLRGRWVFLTGDTLSPDASGFLEATRVESVARPFMPDQIRRAVRRALRA